MAKKKNNDGIPVYEFNEKGVRVKKVSSNILTAFKTRISTQARAGNKSGTLFFVPSIIQAMLKRCGHGEVYDNWLENTLKTVYFELFSGEIIPLSAIKSIILKKPSSEPNQVFETNALIGSIKKFERKNSNSETVEEDLLKNNEGQEKPASNNCDEITIKWEDLTTYTPQQQEQNKANYYEVYAEINGRDKIERVYVGDEFNLVPDSGDLTLDHVVPILEVRNQYRNELTYIGKIDALIREYINKKHPKATSSNYKQIYREICYCIYPDAAKKARKAAQKAEATKEAQEIAGMAGKLKINLNDEEKRDIVDNLTKELALIVRATRGIRVCSSRVNKLSV